jgi:hypothetical protein
MLACEEGFYAYKFINQKTLHNNEFDKKTIYQDKTNVMDFKI